MKKGIALNFEKISDCPGSILPLIQHTLVCQSMLFTFDTEETVALLGDKIDDVQRYKYAIVKSFPKEVNTRENDLGQQSYQVLEENETIKTYKHSELYKII